MEARLDREAHEAADIFPIDEESLGDLAKDIRANGQQVPIELLDGKIIDGRRRYKACRLAGVEPKFRDVTPTDPVAYVLSLNLHRRHLTASQRAMIGARAREMYDKAAKERQRVRKGNQRGTTKAKPPELSKPGQSRDEAGRAVGVGGRLIDRATKVLKDAVPEVVKLVDEGKLAADKAAIISELPRDDQHAAAEQAVKNSTAARRSTVVAEVEIDADEQEDDSPREILGIGIIKANEAIDCLSRIPKDDALRNRGFQLVTDWLKHNH